MPLSKLSNNMIVLLEMDWMAKTRLTNRTYLPWQWSRHTWMPLEDAQTLAKAECGFMCTYGLDRSLVACWDTPAYHILAVMARQWTCT